MELNQAIQKLIDENDVDILKERRFLTLLNEHLAFADMPFAAQMLQQIYNNGYGTKIHKIYCNKNSDDVTAFLSELRNKFGFDIVMLRKVFGEFGFPIVSKQKTKQNQIPCTFDDMELIRYEGRKAYKDEYGGIYSYPNAEIFYGLKDKNIILYDIKNTAKLIYNGAFKECPTFMKVTIPNTVVGIGAEAFYGCSLQQITIPDSVTTIGNSAFENCSSLKEINIPNSVKSIGSGAFGSCSSLQKITIPDSVTTIENGTFWKCTSLKEIDIPNSVKSIGSGAFGSCESLKQIDIPSSVTNIIGFAFAGCRSLQKVSINNPNTIIEKDAFIYCDSLKEIKMPSNSCMRGLGNKFGCKNATIIYF